MLVVDGIGLLRSAPERDRYLPGGIGTGHLQTDVRPKRINQRANQLLRVAWLPDGKSFCRSGTGPHRLAWSILSPPARSGRSGAGNPDARATATAVYRMRRSI